MKLSYWGLNRLTLTEQQNKIQGSEEFFSKKLHWQATKKLIWVDLNSKSYCYANPKCGIYTLQITNKINITLKIVRDVSCPCSRSCSKSPWHGAMLNTSMHSKQIINYRDKDLNLYYKRFCLYRSLNPLLWRKYFTFSLTQITVC